MSPNLIKNYFLKTFKFFGRNPKQTRKESTNLIVKTHAPFTLLNDCSGKSRRQGMQKLFEDE